MSDKPKTEVIADTTRTEGREPRQIDHLKLFIGWSGPLSESIATRIREWIPLVIPDADPWMSAEDIQKGLPWRDQIGKQIIDCDASLTIVTKENLTSPWLLFEAGAVSLAFGEKRCCTILVDVESSEVKGPLSALQHTLIDSEDMLRLVTNLNGISNLRQDANVLEKRFDQNWADLKSQVAKAISDRGASTDDPLKRTTHDLVEEVLLLTRSIRSTLEKENGVAQRPFDTEDDGGPFPWDVVPGQVLPG